MKYDLTAAVIGTGFIGKQHINILKDMADKLIICSADKETGSALSKKLGLKFYSDYEKMFKEEQIDFVSVCLPTNLHYSCTKKALENGINVLCEKPFASDLAQAEDMAKTAKEKNLTLMVGHCARFSKQSEYLKRCVQDERFGKLVSLSFRKLDPAPSWSVGGWLLNPSVSGGPVYDLHIHDTDAVLNTLGMPKSVITRGNTEYCHTTYDFGGNISVTASASWLPYETFKAERNFIAVFENACIVKKDSEDLYLYTKEGTSTPLDSENFPEYFDAADSLSNELHYFCHCLSSGKKPEMCMPEDSLKTVKIALCEAESLKTGNPIDIK